MQLQNALAGLLASALSAGFFYTYSISVMPGLAAADPSSTIRAMQGINAVIRTPIFAFAFFGALVLPLAVSLAAWIGRERQVAVLAVTALQPCLIGAACPAIALATTRIS